MKEKKQKCRGRIYGYVLEEHNLFVSIDGKTVLEVWDENMPISFPKTVKYIASLDNAHLQTNLVIPQNIKKIGLGAFENCESLESIVFESTDIELGYGDSEYIMKEYELDDENHVSDSEEEYDSTIYFINSLETINFEKDIIFNNAIIKIGLEKEVYHFDENIKYIDFACLEEGIKELYLPNSINSFNVSIPNSLEIIEFPKRLKELKFDLPYESKLKRIFLPENLECELEIGTWECQDARIELIYRGEKYVVSSEELSYIYTIRELVLDVLKVKKISEEDDRKISTYCELEESSRNPFIINSSFNNPFSSSEFLEINEEYIFKPRTFINCTQLNKVSIVDGPYYYSGAFFRCGSIKEVIFNTKIANLNIFHECADIETIILDENVEYLIPSGLSLFPNLKQVKLVNNKHLTENDGIIYKNDIPVFDINEKQNIYIFALNDYYGTEFSTVTNCSGIVGFDQDIIPDYYLSGLSIDKFEVPANVRYLGLSSLYKTKEIVLYNKNIYSLFCVGNSWGHYAFHSNGKYIMEAIWNNHLITMKDCITGKIIYRIYMGCDGEKIEIKNVFGNAVRRLPNFTFEDLDIAFDLIKKVSNKLLYALYRVETPYELSLDLEEKYNSFLKKNSKKLFDLLLERNMTDVFEFLINNDIFNTKEKEIAIKYIKN